MPIPRYRHFIACALARAGATRDAAATVAPASIMRTNRARPSGVNLALL